MNSITWILERDVFENGDVLLDAATRSGEIIQRWTDDLWRDGFPEVKTEHAIFHGSLQNARMIHERKLFQPGAFYHDECYDYSFACRNFPGFILNQKCVFTTIRDFLGDPVLIDDVAGVAGGFFTRPDSPLKHFSGRVLSKVGLTKESFDYGFYHDDLDLRIAVSEKRAIDREWRFVCVDHRVITGSEYIAKSRTGVRQVSVDSTWEYAQNIADQKLIPDKVYVVDVCLSEGQYKLLEFNPFSGADLYCCDAELLIEKIKECVCSKKH